MVTLDSVEILKSFSEATMQEVWRQALQEEMEAL